MNELQTRIYKTIYEYCLLQIEEELNNSGALDNEELFEYDYCGDFEVIIEKDGIIIIGRDIDYYELFEIKMSFNLGKISFFNYLGQYISDDYLIDFVDKSTKIISKIINKNIKNIL